MITTGLSLCHKAALEYLQMGWSVIPLCPKDHQGCSEQHKQVCTRMGKTPVIPWKDLQENPPKEKMIHLWWNKNPERNIGIALGPVSGLVGLDIDSGEGADLILQWAQGQEIPTTLEFATPSGFRLLFRWPASDIMIPNRSFRNQDNKEILRVLSKGSQTVLPPSRLAKGEYSWKKGQGPKDIKPAPLPAWLLEQILKQEPKHPPLGVPKPLAMEDSDIKRASAYLAKCEPCVSGKGGHNQLWKVTCYLLHGFHLDKATALAMLQAEYNPRCEPPWSVKELEHKIEQAREKGSAPDMGPAKEKPSLWQGGNPPSQGEKIKILSKKMSHVVIKKKEWLWQGWIPLGKLTVLDGDPDLGKSTVLLDLAARVSVDGTMPDGTQGITGDVAIMSAEDDPEDTIAARLMAAGANLERIHFWDENTLGQVLQIPESLNLIKDQILSEGIRLLIIDPLSAYLSVCLKSDAEVRSALKPLSRIARELGVAVVYLRHLNKSAGTKAIYRGGGSIAIIAAARSAMLVAEDPQDVKGHRILAHVKSNLSQRQPSLRYKLSWIEQYDACRVEWDAEPAPYKADDLLKVPPSEEELEEKEEKKSKLQEAKDFLIGLLINGPVPVKTVKKEAAAEGIRFDPTVRRAKNELKIVMANSTQGRIWSLPGNQME
jgi:hypothetical protein